MTSGSADGNQLSQVSIEGMTSEHLDEVLGIERQCFPSAWSRQSYERELRNSNSYYFVATDGARVIGYVGMWVIRDEAHITTLAVRVDWRRRGLGSRLLAYAVSLAQGYEVAKVTLEVRERNYPARALYEKFGFEPTSFLPSYYGDTGEDALVMRKFLSPDSSRGPCH